MFCVGYPGRRESQILTHLGKELTFITDGLADTDEDTDRAENPIQDGVIVYDNGYARDEIRRMVPYEVLPEDDLEWKGFGVVPNDWWREAPVYLHGVDMTAPSQDESDERTLRWETHVTFCDGEGIHVTNVMCGRQHMFYENCSPRYFFFTEGCHVFMILSPIYSGEMGIVGIDFDEDELAGPYNIPKLEVCGESMRPMLIIPDDIIACHDSAVDWLFDEKCKKCPKESWDRYETCECYDGYLEGAKRRRENTDDE